MKRFVLLMLMAIAAISGFWYVMSGSESDWIVLDSKEVIHVGEEWELLITIEDASAGDTVDVALLNGLQVFEDTLVLGTGGIAIWRIPEDQIIQAGESLLLVRFADKTVKRSLIVKAGEPVDGVLFTTANTLPAYGEGLATIMFLAQDKWGNIPTLVQPFYLNIRFPDEPLIKEILTYENGLGRFHLQSNSGPGRVRLSVEQELIDTHLELMQTAGAPHSIDFSVTPDCVLNDGRDVMALSALVMDQNHKPVVDGTLVTFIWSGGLGYGRTIDGTATLRLPAPDELGQIIYQAESNNIRSKAVTVQIMGDTCP